MSNDTLATTLICDHDPDALLGCFDDLQSGLYKIDRLLAGIELLGLNIGQGDEEGVIAELASVTRDVLAETEEVAEDIWKRVRHRGEGTIPRGRAHGKKK